MTATADTRSATELRGKDKELCHKITGTTREVVRQLGTAAIVGAGLQAEYGVHFDGPRFMLGRHDDGGVPDDVLWNVAERMRAGIDHGGNLLGLYPELGLVRDELPARQPRPSPDRIREVLRQHGHKVGDRGRIGADLLALYDRIAANGFQQ